MALAFAFSEELGLCSGTDRAHVEAHLEAVGLPGRIDQIPGDSRPTAEVLMPLIAQDKKVRGGKPVFVLVRGIGEDDISIHIEGDVGGDVTVAGRDAIDRTSDGT